MTHLYKSRLQNYAQKWSIALPMYSCQMQGPAHARLFKARVTIDGVSYEGPEFCTTLKDAEHAAAKVALTSLFPAEIREEDGLYKSLLQELAQKKGLSLPAYATNRTGPPHLPSFVSNVEIAGESFVGQEARTKKQAEMNAAKVAFIALTEGQAKEKHILTLQRIAIHEPVPNATPAIFKAMQLNISRGNLVNQGGRAHDTEPDSNGKRKRSLANDSAPNSVTDSGTVRPRQTKIVIHPHKLGMIYKGPVQYADDEWVAMMVNIDERCFS